MSAASADNSSVPVWIYKLPLPKTQRLQFETTFKNVDGTTLETFRSLSGIREGVKGMLDLDSMQATAAALEKYMPGFFGLMQAGEALPPEFSKFLKLTWFTPISTKYSSTPFTYSGFRWEVVMCLLGYGIALRNQANDLLQSTAQGTSPDFDEKSKSIAGLLTKAAGVFEHIYQQELANWKVKPDVVLAETSDETFLALTAVCLAEAEEITIKKGLMKGTSPGALSKVAIDVFQKFDHAASLLRSINGLPVEQMLAPFVNYVGVSAKMWKAISYKLLAQDYYSKSDYGNAVAFINAAVLAATDEKKDPMLENFLALYNQEKEVIKALKQNYVNENDSIYYEKIPNDISLPEGKCLTKVTPFVPPQPLYIHIVQKKGAECSIQ